MIKVFLVEDEIVVREGIKNNVDWKGHGFDFCGEASDGELAFPMIQKLKPDIVITDIRMPFMDGVELSKLVKKELPQTEIVFLSGYEEFEYAKEGIKIGIAQYLTKPISGGELLRVIGELAEKIEKRRLEEEFRLKYIKDEEETRAKERRDLFGHLISGDMNASGILEIAGRLSVDISALWYNVCLFRLKADNRDQNEYSQSIVDLNEQTANYAVENGLLLFDTISDGKAVIFKGDSEKEVLKEQEKHIEAIKKALVSYPNVTYFFALGMPVNRLGAIPESYDKASLAYAHKYMMKGSTVLDYKDIEKNNSQNDDFNINEIDLKQIERKKVEEFLKTGENFESRYFVEEFFNNLGPNMVKSVMFRQYILMDIYFCVGEFVEGLGFSKDEIKQFDMVANTKGSTEDTKNYVLEIINKALNLRDMCANDRYSDIVEEVKKYIEENYANDELGLNEMAAHINFSPNHLSMVFSQETGGTIIKYLTDYRLNKAKEMLRCTNKRSSEISLEVGYKDPHYFSFLFKKSTGVTPTQYRSGQE